MARRNCGRPAPVAGRPGTRHDVAAPSHPLNTPLPVAQERAALPPAKKKDHGAEGGGGRGRGKFLQKLAPMHEEAAILDAWGLSAVRIAAEFNVRPETVSGWRRSTVYLERRQEELALILANKSSRRERSIEASYEAYEAVRDMLVRDLTAADPAGNPLYGIRHSAAKILAEDKARNSEYADSVAAKVEAKVAVGAVFHVYPDGIESKPREEVIDVEAEEV